MKWEGIEQMIINRDAAYYLQLPYLNEYGDPRTVRLNSSFDAEQLRDAKTHRILQAEKGSYVVVPIVPAATNVEYQIGSARV